MKGDLQMASIEINEEEMYKEIKRQIEAKIPSEIDITLFCDKWNTIFCTEYGSTDKDGYPLPRHIACKNCIEKSIKENPEFVMLLLQRYLESN
jgi:hypothetical protein